MDPWHLRKRFCSINTIDQCDLDIYKEFKAIESDRKATRHNIMSNEEYDTWLDQYTAKQAEIVKNQVEYRLGLHTTDQNNAAIIQEAQKIANKILEYVNNGVANPFAVAEIRNMFHAGSGASTFEMSRMKDLLDEMSATITDPFVMDQFKGVLLEIEHA
jgi:hypothetical protein